MFKVPAICDSCGAVFPSGLVLKGDIRDLTLLRNSAGPCPKCGMMGHVLEGTFDFVNGALNVIWASKTTVQDLERLRSILRLAHEQDRDYKELQQDLNKTVPKFRGLFALLPGNRQESYAFIAMLLALVTVLLMLRQQTPEVKNLTDVEVNQVIEQTVNIYLNEEFDGRSQVED